MALNYESSSIATIGPAAKNPQIVSVTMNASPYPGDICGRALLGAMLSTYLPRIDGFAVLIKAIAFQSRQGGI